MKKKSINKKLYYLLGLLFIFLVWELLSIIFDENSLIFPSFTKVLEYSLNLLKRGYVYKCLLSSLSRMLIGFIISCLFALFIGTISGINIKFKYFFAPFINALKSIPTASLVFLFLVVLGAKNTPILIVSMVCFPILYENVVSGYENIGQTVNDMLKMDNGSVTNKIINVRLPLAIDGLKTGIKSSLGLSFKIEIMAEVISGSSYLGLGSAISYIQKADPTNMTGILSFSLLAVIISLIIDIILEKTLYK